MVSPTRLMVLGATHLGRGEMREPDEALERIVARIVGWQPDAITIETLPGELVVSYRELGGPFADLSVGGFQQAVACADAVRGLHSWNVWEARAAGADRSRSLEDRVVAWCAAYEPFTALVLARRASTLSAHVSAALDGVAARGDERIRVAGEAAALLGLERLHPFDDHSNWAAFADISDDDYAEAMRDVSERARRHPQVAELETWMGQALDDSDLWPLWRRLNSTEAVGECDELESGLFLTGADPLLPRKALAGWRARNLLMAAHLRSISGDYPGGRVLALVGQSHKGPIEAALSTDQWDIELADVSELDD